jgi:hypothetical protein
MPHRIASLGLALLLAAPAAASVGYDKLFPRARFDPAVPTQEAVVGVVPGARPIRHDELMRYVQAVAAASKRVRVLPYAKSWEGRELVVIAVSDEATIAVLDAFREEHARLMDPRVGGEPAASKAVAWMAYGIHGDELSSTDAAAAVLYWLAAGEDDAARAIRAKTLVLIDPCENPDGRDRFLAMLRSFGHQTPTADLEDLSHTAVWPWGRTNHYLFDLNRDWITLVQPETRRVAEIARWLPQLMVDSHEMGATDTYLFSPARPPFNPFLPKRYHEWAARYAADQARALDAKGYPYYRGEWADEFFVGYGSSWAMYHGAIGILYEMSGTDGTIVLKPTGETRTYDQAVEHQVASSVSNLTTLAAHAADALRATIAARRDGVASGGSGLVRAWFLERSGDLERVDALARLLRDQGIEVLASDKPMKVAGLRDIGTGEAVSTELPAGSYMVPMSQPAWHLARTILDPHVPMEATFLREERESIERGRGTRIYDTTAWSLPLAQGVAAYWTAATPGTSGWSASAAPPAAPAGIVPAASREPVAWVFDGGTDGAAAAVAELLARGVTLRVAEKPFTVQGKSFLPGAILVRREGNPKDAAATLEAVGKSRKVAIIPMSTALADKGADLGGSYFHPLVAPRVGVFAGPLAASSEYGAIWHDLDVELGLRFTAIDLASFRSSDLRRYNVLVLPSTGDSGAARGILGKEGLDALKRWVEAGGTLIGIGSGAELIADKDAGLTTARLRRQAQDIAPSPVWSVAPAEAVAAAPIAATGLAASDLGEPPKKAEPARAASAYDVAPVIGPGAKPFVEGVSLGTPLPGRPMALDAWLSGLLPAGQDKPKDEDRRRADARLRSFSSPGAFLRIDLDPDLYLNWGSPAVMTAFVGAEDTLIAAAPARAAARFAGLETIHRGGLLWPEAAARLAKTAYATREPVGRGQIILFLDNPVYRGWMRGTRRLFWNAILYGPGVGAEPPAPW